MFLPNHVVHSLFLEPQNEPALVITILVNRTDMKYYFFLEKKKKKKRESHSWCEILLRNYVKAET